MKKKILVVSLILSILLVILIASFIIYQVIATYQAHSTFDGYCKWRGLNPLSQLNDSGYCEDVLSGQVFKMVLVGGRWYLDGDLPNNWPF